MQKDFLLRFVFLLVLLTSLFNKKLYADCQAEKSVHLFTVGTIFSAESCSGLIVYLNDQSRASELTKTLLFSEFSCKDDDFLILNSENSLNPARLDHNRTYAVETSCVILPEVLPIDKNLCNNNVFKLKDLSSFAPGGVSDEILLCVRADNGTLLPSYNAFKARLRCVRTGRRIQC